MTLSKQRLNWLELAKKPLRASFLAGFLSFSFLVLNSFDASAQRLAVDAAKGTNNHVMYLEFGGAGYIYSVNYERLLLHRKNVCNVCSCWF